VLTAEPNGDGQLEVRYLQRRYSVPVAEAIVLPVNNTSAENLATWIGQRLQERIRQQHPQSRIAKLSIGVEETPGQMGVYQVVE
jgi:hypothetical protein